VLPAVPRRENAAQAGEVVRGHLAGCDVAAMSGLYNIIFGESGMRGVIFAMLGTSYFGRYRDCWIEMDGDTPRIAIYTRNGGGNRECYDEHAEDDPRRPECYSCWITHEVHKHPLYLFDRDGDFDCTYATIYYSVPEEFVEDCKRIALKEPLDMSERWLTMIESIKGTKP
jgi:hypothetical protein